VLPGDRQVAFTVEEDYQGLGIASRLLEHLVRIARDRGIAEFVAEVLPRNTAMLRVFTRSGLPMMQSVPMAWCTCALCWHSSTYGSSGGDRSNRVERAMKNVTIPGRSATFLRRLAEYPKDWLRPDLIAGLTTAAVVIPKAMAYATIAGLPVEVGLYTAFVPMVIYALLGSSRPLSVSTTTTIAILTAAALGEVALGGKAELLIAAATLSVMVGAILVLAALLRLGCRQLHLRAGVDRVQGRHRSRDRRRPSQDPGCPPRQGAVLPQPGLHRPAPAADIAADARARAPWRDHRR
jgi:hypothetical protein